MLDFFPQYFTKKATLLYFISLVLVSFFFLNHVLPFTFWIIGIIEVVGFFYFSNLFTKNWGNISVKVFQKRLFWTAFSIRFLWVIISYFLYITWTGRPFEWMAGDSVAYHDLAVWLSALIEEGDVTIYFKHLERQYSDTGYPTYLGVLYYFTGDSIIIARIFKAFIGAFTSLLIYRLASRTFGESTGRMSGIFVMLMPSLIYYTGLHLKEVEMLFLTVWFLERTDALLRNKKFSFNTLWLPILLVVLLFFFRTVLGVTSLFALFSALFLSSERATKIGTRIVASVWFIVAVGYFVGTQYVGEVSQVWNQRSTSQSASMQWRSTREDGANKYAKYASTAVFAPLIFVIPFPTIVNVTSQENQMLLNGANFIKNIMAFFVMFSLFWMFKEKKWREYLLIITFVIGYLAVIAMSSFAHSERFHQPVIPIFLILAALGVSKITNKQKKYFNIYMFIIFAIIVGWSWFKLSGKGLI